jgi:hypothetical protein
MPATTIPHKRATLRTLAGTTVNPFGDSLLQKCFGIVASELQAANAFDTRPGGPYTLRAALALPELEFAALRAAIAARGTVRMALLPVTVIGWALLAALALLLRENPFAGLLALAVLAAGFEAIHALHVGAERVGRYLQVFYENGPGVPRWETTAMAVGPALPGGGIDPLFSAVFVGAGVLNLLPLVTSGLPVWSVALSTALHVIFVYRVVRARGAAARQRAIELESFRALRDGERDRA